MARYAAFLRAINVGGRVVTMARLRATFETAGLANVRTVLASGNVAFEAGARSSNLEKRIAASLQKALGYRVDTFVRSAEEVAAIAAAEPFPPRALADPGTRLFVVFLSAPLRAAATKTVLAMASDVDELTVSGREIYWLCRVPMAKAEFSPARLEKALEAPATFRNVTTVKKIASVLA